MTDEHTPSDAAIHRVMRDFGTESDEAGRAIRIAAPFTPYYAYKLLALAYDRLAKYEPETLVDPRRERDMVIVREENAKRCEADGHPLGAQKWRDGSYDDSHPAKTGLALLAIGRGERG